MFSKVRAEDCLEARLKELQQSDKTYTKKQVQEQLGVTASQLNIIAKKYGIDPFWRQAGGEKEEGGHKLSLVLDDKEYGIYKAAFHESGYRFDRHFIKDCLLTYIRENLKHHNDPNSGCI